MPSDRGSNLSLYLAVVLLASAVLTPVVAGVIEFILK